MGAHRRFVTAGAGVILGPPMESFLDRLLADPQAGVAVDAPRPSETWQQVPRQGPPPGTSPPLPAPPRGTAAPRIAVYDTLTSPPRVLAVEEDDLPALIASLAEKTYAHCREQGGFPGTTPAR